MILNLMLHRVTNDFLVFTECASKARYIIAAPRCSLKVVSAIFLLVSSLSENESTYQTRKSVSYFTSKALSILEKIKF